MTAERDRQAYIELPEITVLENVTEDDANALVKYVNMCKLGLFRRRRTTVMLTHDDGRVAAKTRVHTDDPPEQLLAEVVARTLRKAYKDMKRGDEDDEY